MKQSTLRYLSLLMLGSGLIGVACSDDDDDPSTGLGGSGGSGTAGSAGAAGAAGAAGSAGSSAGGSGGSSAGAAGSAGSAGAAGASGAAGAAGAAGSGGAAGASGETPDAGSGAFTVSSPAFDDEPGCSADNREVCDLFPDENTGLGEAENVSPEINWTGAPAGTQSFAIALHDLAFIQGATPFTHWVMWNIPGTETGLPAELPQGVMPGVPAANTQQYSFREDNRGYTGSGACGNVYEFVLYALSTPTFTPPNPSDQNAVQDALDASDDVLGTATMRARSDPNGPSCN